MIIDIKLLHPDAKVPARSKPDDAGADLHALHSVTLEPGMRAVVKTGIAVAVPRGYYGRVAPRSGLAVKHGLDTLAGVVDCGYTGDVSVVLVNHGDSLVILSAGDRIAQLIIEKIETPEWRVAEDLGASARGADGWGSSGI